MIRYRDAGVDIDAGERLVDRIRPLARAASRPEVIGGIGGFAGLFRMPALKDGVLVASTDGVGTKVKVAIAAGRHDTIGIDLVAMCANDVAVIGAEPLLLLDYFACGRLCVDVAERVVAGVAEGCRQAGCALLGGETAEMPGLYAPGDYDLAGFCVGAAERAALIDGSRIQAGDALVGIASTGLHANGYSLARRVLLPGGDGGGDGRGDGGGDAPVPADLIEELLRPTRIYVATIRALRAACDVRGLAHITGGGLCDNPPRMLPEGSGLRIELSWDWQVPPIFARIRAAGVPEHELRRTFNLGVGLIACVPAAQAAAAIAAAGRAGDRAFPVGTVAA